MKYLIKQCPYESGIVYEIEAGNVQEVKKWASENLPHDKRFKIWQGKSCLCDAFQFTGYTVSKGKVESQIFGSTNFVTHRQPKNTWFNNPEDALSDYREKEKIAIIKQKELIAKITPLQDKIIQIMEEYGAFYDVSDEVSDIFETCMYLNHEGYIFKIKEEV